MTEATLPEFLTVRELADFLRIKERKVYDLAATGKVPCTRVTGKLLFPADEVRAWVEGHHAGPETRAERPVVFLGSHDPLLSWALGQSRCGIATLFDGSLDGLARFRAHEGIATGLHIRDGFTGDWNVRHVRRDAGGLGAVLIAWTSRRRGLVVRPEDAGRITGVSDLRRRRLAGRQAESGTDVLLGELLSEAGIPRAEVFFTAASRNETDAVLEVAQGTADVAFGLETVARQYGLEFVPVIDERFDILVDRRSYFEPPMQRFLAFCRGADFAEHAAALGGYDLSEFGAVRWNG